jgi:hypothetical protein
MGNSGQGQLLTGQVQAVKQGAGIIIDGSGTISVDWTSSTSLVKLNNPGGYNSYVWPSSPATSSTFLSNDGNSTLSWSPLRITTSSISPTSPSIGQLWFDCGTGYLKVWEECTTGVPQWVVVSRGLDVDPTRVSSSGPAFTGGSGTLSSPYLIDSTILTSGASAQIPNIITVTGLAPYQYVPVVDKNAATNGYRFSFSNYFTDSTGTLVFKVLFNDSPVSPAGTSYIASIKIGFASAYISTSVEVTNSLTLTSPGVIDGSHAVGATIAYTPGTYTGGVSPVVDSWVWRNSDDIILQTGGTTYDVVNTDLGTKIFVDYTATDATSTTVFGTTVNFPTTGVITEISILSTGTITGSTIVGSTLNYTTGSATGGSVPYLYSWAWKRESTDSVLQYDGNSYIVISSLAGDRVYVTLTAIDSNSQQASGDTDDYPAPPSTLGKTLFPLTINYPTATQPTVASTAWTIPADSLQSSGCVEISTNSGVTWGQGPYTIANGGNLLTRWIASALCGNVPSGTTITGNISSPSYDSSGSLSIDRVPNPFSFTPVSNIVPLQVATSNSVTPGGFNSTAYVTYDPSSSATVIQASADGGATWTTLLTSGTSFPINPGQNIHVRCTVGSGLSTLYTSIIRIGEDSFQSATFAATTAAGGVFPLTPIAFPSTTTSPSGTATWADGATTLTSTDCIEFSVNGGVYSQGPTAITNGQTISTQWNNGLSCGGAAHGTTITGTITDGTYTNSSSLTLDRIPNSIDFTNLAGQAVSTQVSSNTITVAGTNSASYVTLTAEATPLTSVEASIAGGAFTAVPTSGTTMVVNPGQTIQIRGTTGSSTNVAYAAKINIGQGVNQVFDTWSVTTVAVPASVSTPTITSPLSGATGVGTSSGITVSSSAYTPLNGASLTQKCSDWEVYKDGYPGITSTNTVTPTTSFSQVSSSPSWPIAYGNGVFMTVNSTGLGGPVLTSIDGSTWSTVGNTTAESFFLSWTGSVWYAVGTGVTGLPQTSSNNGVTWGSTNNPYTSSSNSSAFGISGSTFIEGIDNDGSGYTGYIYRSANSGSTWTSVYSTGLLGGIITGVANTGSGVWVTVRNASSKILRSVNDGVSWTVSTTTLPALKSIAWAGSVGVFAAVGASGAIRTSADSGVTWSTRTSGVTTTLNKVIFANNAFYAVGDSGTVITSTNGTTWTPITTGVTASFRDVAYSTLDGSLILTSSSGIYKYAANFLTVSGIAANGFAVGMKIKGNTSGATGYISAISSTGITLSGITGTFVAGETVSADPTSIVSVTCDTTNKTSYTIAKPPLAALTLYYARVRYNSNDAVPVLSAWSGWSGFTTGNL